MKGRVSVALVSLFALGKHVHNYMNPSVALEATGTFKSKPIAMPYSIIGDNPSASDDDDNDGTSIRPRNFTLIYVHVGKTGGTSLETLLRSNCMWYTFLRIRQQCLLNLGSQENESAVSIATKATVHLQKSAAFNEWITKANGFLVTARNPVQRIVSAFNMEHPRNTVKRVADLENMRPSVREFYLECFPTVEDLAQRLHAHQYIQNKTKSDGVCYNLGVKALHGQGNPHVAGHLSKNYEHYGKYTFLEYPARPALVARTEQLWEDMKVIDQYLGGSGEFPTDGHIFSYGSEKYVVHDGLSQLGNEIICCFIASDLSVYEDLVRRAVNLSQLEKDDTMARVYKDCGLTQSSLATDNFVALQSFGVLIGKPFPWEEWARSENSGCPL